MPPRTPIALALPQPLPPLPLVPHPSPSPLQAHISSTLNSTDHDLVAVPLTNGAWQERWERLCLRPLDENENEHESENEDGAAEREAAREALDREADVWRKDGGLLRGEMNVTRLEETQHMIAIAAEWLELDSEDEGIRFDSELALRAEMSQALYLSIPTLVVPAPSLANRAHLPSYARAIANLLQIGGAAAYTQVVVRIPISDPTELIQQGPAGPVSPGSGTGAGAGAPTMAPPPPPTSKAHKRISSLSTRPQSFHQSQGSASGLQPFTSGAGNGSGSGSGSLNGHGNGHGMRTVSGASAFSQASSVMSARSTATVGGTAAGGSALGGDPNSTWEMWDTIRAICGYHPRLSVMLDLTNPLPPSAGALSRWSAEPVKFIWLPSASFIPNAKGYPVLSKACQAFLRGLGKSSPTYILSPSPGTRHANGGPSAYLQYIRHITSQAPLNAHGQSDAPDYTAGYADYLQAPLQPLMDDLGSATYDVFERDPVKYRQYEEAIVLALGDLEEGARHVITVVGAGRGPLVACALRAMKRANRRAMVYAVEKNASAFVTLQERKELEWHDTVEIFFGDMRSVDVPEQADIMVSELLGSFADNELSPECLDGAMRFLKPSGISIPMSYTAHLAPLSSSKLYADVSAASRTPAAAETPYVVMMSQVNLLSADTSTPGQVGGERVQQCWQFEHPRRDLILDATGAPLTNSHNTRSATLVFTIPHSAPCHGLAGYFEAHLYGNVGLSTHPDNAHRVSPEMFSWFPLFFPFRQPLYLPSGAQIEVNVWRLSDARGRKVWYEWSAEAFLVVPAGTGAGGAGAGGGGSVPNSASVSTRDGMLSADAQGQGAPLKSPLVDATFSPARAGFADAPGPGPGPVGAHGSGQAWTRVKIGQTGLHNPGGVHSWVGL